MAWPALPLSFDPTSWPFRDLELKPSTAEAVPFCTKSMFLELQEFQEAEASQDEAQPGFIIASYMCQECSCSCLGFSSQKVSLEQVQLSSNLLCIEKRDGCHQHALFIHPSRVEV